MTWFKNLRIKAKMIVSFGVVLLLMVVISAIADIAQINTGIDQVAQVVQQNSATAEESAAASQEMSSQSVMLEELIAQFRLRDNGKSFSGTQPAKLSTGKDYKISENPVANVAHGVLDFGKY